MIQKRTANNQPCQCLFSESTVKALFATCIFKKAFPDKRKTELPQVTPEFQKKVEHVSSAKKKKKTLSGATKSGSETCNHFLNLLLLGFGYSCINTRGVVAMPLKPNIILKCAYDNTSKYSFV